MCLIGIDFLWDCISDIIISFIGSVPKNAHMVHIVGKIPFLKKRCIHLRRSLLYTV